jgi:hypothetical protein
MGRAAPEEPTECLAPCPDTTERAGAVLDLLRLAGRQLRLGFEDVVGFDWNVIARLADDAEVATDPEWWRLVAVVEGEMVAQIRKAKDPKEPG